MDYEHKERELPEPELAKAADYTALKMRVEELERVVRVQANELRRLRNSFKELGGNFEIMRRQKK